MSFWSRWFGARPPAPETTIAEPAGPPDYPYPLVAVPGHAALAEWRRLREAWRAEGCSPVVLGDREELASMAEAREGAETTPAQVLEAAAAKTAEQVFAVRLEDHRELDDEDEPVPGGDLYAPRGEWPATASPHTLGAHADIVTGKPKPTVYIAKIPTPRSWEIPAYLLYGGWNDCPFADEHVAVHRRWHERYGSEIYAVAGDIVECWVPRPPADRAAAEALAREQYLYASDIVEQGTNTLLGLAAALKGADAWFFWWD